MVGTEAVLGLLVPSLLAIGFIVGLQLLSRFEEAAEQADLAGGTERERDAGEAAGEEGRQAPRSAAARRLRELKALLDDGLITESEFEAKKAEMLREL